MRLPTPISALARLARSCLCPLVGVTLAAPLLSAPLAAQTHAEPARAGHAHHAPSPATSAEQIVTRPITRRAGLGRVHETVPGAPAEAQTFYDQGLAYLHSYAWLDAARSLNQALRLHPAMPLAQLALARAHLGLNDPAGAARALAGARALASPTDARTMRRVRILETRLASIAAPGDAARLAAYRQAIEDALAHELDNPELWLLRGNAEEAMTGAAGIGQFGGAGSIAFYARALALQPDHPGAHHYLVHSHETIGQIDSALAHGKIYAGLVPAVAHAQHMYAHDLMRVARVPEAIRQLEVADSIERATYAADAMAPDLDWHRPHNVELLGLLYAHQGRLRDAERLLREGRALRPGGPFGYVYLRTLPELLITRGRSAEAEPMLASLVGDTLPGPRAVGHALRGHVRLADGRAADARADLAVAESALARGAPIEAFYFAPYLELLRGAVALADGHGARGDSLLVAATVAARALPGPDGWVVSLLAHDGAIGLARQAGAWELVERLARAFVAHAPSYAPAHHALAMAAERRGDAATARAAYGRALAFWQGADADLPERAEAARALARLGTGAPRAGAPVREGYLAGAGGARLFYRVEGQGADTIVVLHGGPGSSHQYMRAHLGALAERHVVIHYDQRGGGRSTLYRDSAALAHPHFVADLEQVRRHFALGRMTLLGHSWGGWLAALYALEHPGRVARLVLVAPGPPARDPFMAETHREIGRRLATRLDAGARARVDSLQRAMATTEDPAAVCRTMGLLMAPAFVTRPVETIRAEDFCDGTPEAIRRSAATEALAERSLGAFDFRPRVRALRIPTLVVGGAEDPYRTGAEAWSTALPMARLVMVPDAGHSPFLDQPEAFDRAVAAFLTPADARSTTRAARTTP